MGEAAVRADAWSIGGASLSLRRPLVVGILNLTPDSFSDGGDLPTIEAVLERALQMAEQGADLLDIGAESTRPGAAAVGAAEQLQRILPALDLLAKQIGLPLSVDTRSAEVARRALAAGATVINDVSALSDPDMPAAVREADAGLVLMHMRGTPQTMQDHATYADAVGEVTDELGHRFRHALAAGVPAANIVLDPGIGFAKTAEHNLALLAGLDRLAVLGRPLLIGPSRKSFIGQILGGVAPRARIAGTVAACVAGLLRGARLFRVHDVAPVREALDVAEAIRRASPAQG
jgi:dihydropteroate synthase